MRSIPVGDFRVSPRMREYMNQVLDTHRVSYGPFSRRLETLFADVHEVREAIFCSSGTAALHMAVACLKERESWQDGDEVLVPATTFIATVNVVRHVGLKPVYVDVERSTYNLDPAKIEAHITDRTRAVIPVHLMGLPADMDPILEIAERHGLSVIEDSCETMFASYRGRMVGSLGDVACFSTYVAHYIVAGIGGFATTNDPQLAEMMRSYMNHGRDPAYLTIDDDQNVAGEELHRIAARRFSFIRPGHNFRVTEMEAAIGLAQLEEYEEIVRVRTDIASRYIRGLESLSDRIQLPVVPPDRDHVFMLFPLVLRAGNKRRLTNFLEDRGIETRDLMPILSQPTVRELDGDLTADYPVAKGLDTGGFYVGCHQYLDEDQVDFVIRSIQEFFAGSDKPR